jgi:hypothetical protein
MHEVEVSYVVEPSAEELIEHLTPRSILEYAEVYEIRSCERTADGATATVAIDDAEMTLSFSQLENGCEYRVVNGDAMFEARYTKLTVDDGDETRISAVSRYSFDSIWSFILNRLAAKMVQRELEVTITNLLEDVSSSGTNGASDGNG